MKFVIVNAGGFGEVSAERHDYDYLVDLLQETVKQMQLEEPGRYEMVVVNSMDEAEAEAVISDVMVFLTYGMLAFAKKLKAQYRRSLRVIVLTAATDDDDVRVVDKRWLSVRSSEEATKHLLLGP